MGLDSIELVMEIENAFDIKIPDKEAEKIRTVGDFYEVVWKHLRGRHTNKCNSQILYYRLRKTLTTEFGMEPEQLVMDRSPETFFPSEDRKIAYQKFARLTGLDLPSLQLPAPWKDRWVGASTVFILGSLAIEVMFIRFRNYSFWILLFTVLASMIILCVSKLLDPFRTEIPAATTRAFTTQILNLNHKKLTETTGINREEMEAVMNQIIIDKLGVEPSELSPEKSFTDDLGMD